MKISIILSATAATMLLSACATAPQKNIDISPTTFSSKSDRVGVAMTKLPKIDTNFPGAFCLLCAAAASIANSSLTAHTQTLPYEDLPNLKNELTELLRRKGVEAKVISEEIDVDALPNSQQSAENTVKKDFSSLQKKYDLEKILVVHISELGIERPYSAYVPTGEPKAVLRGAGYMVNLKSNSYEWYLPVNVLKSSDGKWDEPPKFPGLSNAYFQALEIGKDSFLRPFKQ